MLAIKISDEAEQDLLDIWYYIAEDNPVNAERFLHKIAAKYHWLAEFGDSGVSREDLLPNLYSFPLDKYMLYYRKDDKTLEIVRIIHSSRDVNQQFD